MAHIYRNPYSTPQRTRPPTVKRFATWMLGQDVLMRMETLRRGGTCIKTTENGVAAVQQQEAPCVSQCLSGQGASVDHLLLGCCQTKAKPDPSKFAHTENGAFLSPGPPPKKKKRAPLRVKQSNPSLLNYRAPKGLTPNRHQSGRMPFSHCVLNWVAGWKQSEA